MNTLHAIVVFVSAAMADVVWAWYTLTVSAHKPMLAGLAAVGILLLGVISIDAYITSRWYVVPAALGGGISTYLTVRHAKKRACVRSTVD